MNAAGGTGAAGSTVSLPAQQPTRVRVQWYRRLGFKLAVLLAILMFLFEFSSPLMRQGLAVAFGWRDPENLRPVGPAGFDDEEFVREAVDEQGHLRPSFEQIDELDKLMQPFGEGFVLLDSEGIVVGHSAELPYGTDPVWDGGFDPYQNVEFGDGRELRATCTPLTREEHGSEIQAGWLVELVLDEDKHAEAHHQSFRGPWEEEECYFHPKPEPDIVTGADLRRISGRENLVAKLMSSLVVAMTVALLALATSRLVTRRLRRLSDQATGDPDVGESLPGPFRVQGEDEIAALATSMNHMRSRVGQLVDTLEQRDRDRREWVAHVSHDLRTPLTALMACLDRARRHAGDEESRTELSRLLGVAELDARRVMTLADDLLEIARLDAGAKRVLEPVPVNELLRKTASALEPTASSSGVDLELDLTSGLPELEADGRLLTRALENLVVNAIQHARSRAVLSARLVDGRCELCVTDDGPGFPSANGEVDLEEVRASLSRSDSTGLGLSVAERVAEAHEGRLVLENPPGGGAFVRLRLPVSAKPPEES